MLNRYEKELVLLRVFDKEISQLEDINFSNDLIKYSFVEANREGKFLYDNVMREASKKNISIPNWFDCHLKSYIPDDEDELLVLEDAFKKLFSIISNVDNRRMNDLKWKGEVLCKRIAQATITVYNTNKNKEPLLRHISRDLENYKDREEFYIYDLVGEYYCRFGQEELYN